jgi:hypothetical protein
MVVDDNVHDIGLHDSIAVGGPQLKDVPAQAIDGLLGWWQAFRIVAVPLQ